jgi:hypothetical protein
MDKTRWIKIPILTVSKRHCSNDCPYMSLQCRCIAFKGVSLTWHDRGKIGAYKRCKPCRKAECNS